MKNQKISEESKRFMSLMIDMILNNNESAKGDVSLVRVKNVNDDDDVKTMIVLNIEKLNKLLPIGFLFGDIEEAMNNQNKYYPIDIDDDDSIETLSLKKSVTVTNSDENPKISKFGLN